jgi:hypothetical protein
MDAKTRNFSEITMNQDKNVAIARALLEGIGGGKDPADIAALFDERLLFEIRSDDGVIPGLSGRRAGAPSPISSATHAR